MDSDGLPIVGPGIDYRKVDAIHQKRTLAFINHFVTHTAQFLNRFSCVCEEKLENLAIRLQRIDATMQLLEAKLSSIPGLENVTVATTTANDNAVTASGVQNGTSTNQIAAEPSDNTESAPTPVQVEVAAVEEPAVATMTVSQDPAYAKYFKMTLVGVPAPAVKIKMAADGLNPDLLDTPNAPYTSTTLSAQVQQTTESSDSEVDLSSEPEETDDDSSSVDFSD